MDSEKVHTYPAKSSAVLSLAIRKVPRWLQDSRSVTSRPVVVPIEILDADHDGIARGASIVDALTCVRSLSDRNSPVAHTQLRPMGSDLPPKGESKGLDEPVYRLRDIRIAQDGDDMASRHRAIRPHASDGKRQSGFQDSLGGAAMSYCEP